MSKAELEAKHLAELHALAAESGVKGYRLMRREELVEELSGRGETEEGDGDKGRAEERPPRRRRRRRRGGGAKADDAATRDEPTERVTGVLEIVSAGHGFLRLKAAEPDSDDVYISASQIRRCELEDGDEVEGPSRPPRGRERHPALVRVELVNGEPPAEPPEEPEEPDRPEESEEPEEEED